MTLTAVATRYANALADVIAPAGLAPEQAVSELRAFEDAFRSSHDLRETLSTPAVPVSRKKAVVDRIAAVLKLSRVTRNFLFVLTDHGRLTALPEIIDGLETALDERMGFAGAEVSSARELNARQMAALQAELERVTGKRIRMRFALDESLIGGVVAKIGSTVYDGSVRSQLQSLERRLAAEA